MKRAIALIAIALTFAACSHDDKAPILPGGTGGSGGSSGGSGSSGPTGSGKIASSCNIPSLGEGIQVSTDKLVRPSGKWILVSQLQFSKSQAVRPTTYDFINLAPELRAQAEEQLNEVTYLSLSHDLRKLKGKSQTTGAFSPSYNLDCTSVKQAVNYESDSSSHKQSSSNNLDFTMPYSVDAVTLISDLAVESKFLLEDGHKKSMSAQIRTPESSEKTPLSIFETDAKKIKELGIKVEFFALSETTMKFKITMDLVGEPRVFEVSKNGRSGKYNAKSKALLIAEGLYELKLE